jgi:hypothetical protein
MKEPWQMTRDEWGRAFYAIGPQFIGSDTGRASSVKGSPNATLARIEAKARLKMGLSDRIDYETGDRLPARHREVIEHALSLGLPVPSEVLEDYPNLVGEVLRDDE